MIHTVYVDANTDVNALKKVFRKKLMTGGAVIRLADGLNEEQMWQIFHQFAADAVSHNVCSMVLRELAESPQTPPELLERLHAMGLQNLKKKVVNY